MNFFKCLTLLHIMHEEWVDVSTFDRKGIRGYKNGRGKSSVRIYETFIITAEKKIKQDAAKIKLQTSEL